MDFLHFIGQKYGWVLCAGFSQLKPVYQQELWFFSELRVRFQVHCLQAELISFSCFPCGLSHLEDTMVGQVLDLLLVSMPSSPALRAYVTMLGPPLYVEIS